MNNADTEAQRLAEACSAVMQQGDGLTGHLGISIDKIAPCFAQVSMQVQDWMTNGHGTCHGGMIFSLADSAFAFSCNTENHPTVAASVSIDYINAAYRGETLVATGQKVSQRGRSGIYDVRVENQNGELIALFRGKSQRIKGAILQHEQPTLS